MICHIICGHSEDVWSENLIWLASICRFIVLLISYLIECEELLFNVLGTKEKSIIDYQIWFIFNVFLLNLLISEKNLEPRPKLSKFLNVI